MIEKYIEAVQKGDYMALAECFSSECSYFDFCPSLANRPNYHIYGKYGVEMFFHNKFVFHTVTVSDAVKENERSATFLVSYAGTFLYARATIDELSEDGLIKTMTIRPA